MDLILMPKDWTLERMAIGKMNEGIEYRKNRDIEKSIECYRYALGILSSDDPVRAMRIRARILINLGNAYLDPIRSFNLDDTKLAIYAYRLALAVFIKDEDPIDWAKAKMNLGAAYGQYAGGNRPDNIEKSIEASQQSLEIFSYEKEPEDWANALMNLGTVYVDRIKGDRSNNILKAINCLRASWRVWKYEIHPHRWAIVMMNLGNAHLSKNFDKRSNSIEASIKSYNKALRVFDKKICAYDWSLAKTNLGNAYLDRIKGNLNQNIEFAINAYRDALEVRTREKMPLDWAITTMNLGQAYLKAKRIEDAILTLNSALNKIEYEKMPLEWAKIKASLGRAYSKRSEENIEENLNIAIEEYQDALKVLRCETFPYLCRAIATELGDLYFDNQLWEKSSEIYKIAVQADEVLYQTSLLSISKEVVVKETGPLYRHISYSLAKSAQLNDSIIFLERGRARILGDDLARDRADLDNVKSKNQKLYNEYIETSTLMRNLDSKSRDFERGSLSENIWVQAERAHEHFNEVIESIRTINGYENFLKKANWIDILEVVCKEQPLVYLATTSHGGLALIIYRSNGPSNYPNENDRVKIKSIWLEEFSDSFLDELLNKESDRGASMGFYISYQYYWKENCTEISDWLESLAWVTKELWQKAMGPIISFLQSIGIEDAFLIPIGLLALLPLHAAWTEKDGKKSYALDYVSFSYVPSARSISIGRCIVEESGTNNFLAILDTTLEKSNEEVEKIAKHFEGTTYSVTIRKDASCNEAIEELLKAKIVHFSCHGDAVLDNPTESSLLMANCENLTVKNISDLNLTNARLVSLSACETGIIGAKLPDEVVSLPTAFMRAGFAGVVTPLWDVFEEDAARIMEEFYCFWIQKGLTPARALRAAQIPVRDNREYVDYFDWAAFYFTGV